MNDDKDKIQSLKSVVERVHDQWVTHDTLFNLIDHACEHLPADLADLADLKRSASFLCSTDESTSNQTQSNVALLQRWHSLSQAPSLTALCLHAVNELGLSLNEQALSGLLIASILGEVENDNPYHNNFHFKKVVLQTIRMIAAHNAIYEGTSNALSDAQSALLLSAACIHDIGHDGMGNTLKGVFTQGRLERQSFDLALPYLHASGCDDARMLGHLKVMLLTTDTSPLGDLSNPMNQMKAAYNYHFLGEKTRTHALNLDTDFHELQTNDKLTLMCLILHEADVATSAGLDYMVTKYETIVFMRELRGSEAYPEHVIDFLNQVCQRKMLSDAGQKLYAANLARIYALAQEDMRQGNHSFPDAAHCDLILSAKGCDINASKTLN